MNYDLSFSKMLLLGQYCPLIYDKNYFYIFHVKIWKYILQAEASNLQKANFESLDIIKWKFAQ